MASRSSKCVLSLNPPRNDSLLLQALLPRFGLKPNPAYEPEEDWAFDCKGRR